MSLQSRTSDSSLGSFPELLCSSEPISLLYRHFPLAFRPFFSYYKINTVRDLSAMSIDRVKTFGIKDPVGTVTRALKEFSGRIKRLKDIASSPFRKRTRSPAANTLAPASPSSRRSPRRTGSTVANSPSLDQSHRKRTKRTLLDLDSDVTSGANGNETPQVAPKRAERVTFCLPSENEATRINLPGEDPQDPNASEAASSAKESSDEKLETFSLKFLQHLRRFAQYLDKLAAENESLQSDTSVQTSANKMSDRFCEFQEAHDVIAAMSRQLQQITEAHGARCQELFRSGQDGK